MATVPERRSKVVAVFGDADAAHAATERLLAAGFGAADVELIGGEAPASATGGPRGGDAPLLGRVFWQIIVWGAVGAVAGGLVGLGLTQAGIGPDGAGAAALQIAGWAMFGHIIASLWAGYAVLGTRATRDLTWQREREGRILVTVGCADAAEADRAEVILRDAGATSSARYAG